MPSGKLHEAFISTLDAGRVLGCSAHTIEYGLRNGSFPIGWAWDSSGRDQYGNIVKQGQWNYRIPREAFFRAIEDGHIYGGDTVPSTYTECRLYKIWSDMKQRCNNKNHKKYHLYGGRGIGYISEWEQFPEFETWAYANGYREYLTLDRVNGERGYYPANCRWATYKEQANNSRRNHLYTLDGETHTISQWAEIWGCPRSTARNRIYRAEAKGNAEEETA